VQERRRANLVQYITAGGIDFRPLVFLLFWEIRSIFVQKFNDMMSKEQHIQHCVDTAPDRNAVIEIVRNPSRIYA